MITVLGSINADQIGVVPRLPNPGETVLGSDFRIEPGGKGANQALAARRAGADVALFGCIGSDPFADVAMRLLREDGVRLAGVRTCAVNTGIAIIVVDEHGENQIAVLPGANGAVDGSVVDQALAQTRGGDILLLQQEIPPQSIYSALRRAKMKGVVTILNIAPFVPQTAEWAKLASVIVANETEFELLVGERTTDLVLAASTLAQQNNQTVVVTRGKDGAIVASPATTISVPAKPVNVVDTVGAGDTFCGYLASAMADGVPAAEAARIAVLAASVACMTRGAQPAIPRAKDIDHERPPIGGQAE